MKNPNYDPSQPTMLSEWQKRYIGPYPAVISGLTQNHPNFEDGVVIRTSGIKEGTQIVGIRESKDRPWLHGVQNSDGSWYYRYYEVTCESRTYLLYKSDCGPYGSSPV